VPRRTYVDGHCSTEQYVDVSTVGLRTNGALGASGQTADYEAACIYDYASAFGVNCTLENKYGYAIGKPCVLMRIYEVGGGIRLWCNTAYLVPTA